ncbi:Peptidase family M50 [uncultured archaeon]|nr:Peptidase family M50 [uncultured archaeon]
MEFITEYLLICFLSLFIHEASHILIARLLCVKVKKIGINWLGTYIVRENGTRWQNVMIGLCGPLSNILMGLLFFRLWNFFFVVNLILGICNLLPIPGSDGMKVVENLQNK